MRSRNWISGFDPDSICGLNSRNAAETVTRGPQHPMLENDLTLAAMAEALAKSADYRDLRRLVRRETFTPSHSRSSKIGIPLDVESTGLDQQKDEVIELGMVKFDYLPDGRIAGLRDVFSSFNEPSAPIPQEVIALTGITNEMIAGQRIDEAAVSSFADEAVIVIAHNASFDRKFAERCWRYSNGRPGAVRRRRSTGGNMASKALAWPTS
ncbi:exonuclease domain-containing protein [Bradyrhizobium sp. Ec3.3]|uniref:exonuclease domain-containing protein n=1 Tax=Bradyrhizobium sp. Ec3.3 TaxID=189753 RepID=UPI003528D686